MKRIYTVLFLAFTTFVFLSNIAFAGGPEPKAVSPWLVYAGVFGGYYTSDYQYGANYFSDGSSNEVYADILSQNGFLSGGQIGFQYHFKSPYFLGFDLSAASNANNGRLTVIAVTTLPAGSVPNINHQFRLGYNVDMTGVMGADVTSQTRIYAKIGASYAELDHNITGTGLIGFPFTQALFGVTEHEHLWGWVVGVGLMQEFSRWINAFVEFDRYDFGTNNLPILDNIFPGNIDRLTQHSRITPSAVRLGVNVKFMNNFMPVAHTLWANPWLVYVGAFAAYYSTNFKYGAVAFSNVISSSQVFNTTTFQEGAAGGLQAGFNYHFQSPYFVGFNFSVEDNAEKARSSLYVVAAPPGGVIGVMTTQFRVGYNLDMAGVLGANITSQTAIYAKIGASYGYLTQNVSGALMANMFPNPIFAQPLRNSLWGWVAGVGLMQDLNRWVNAFVEYDRYDYGTYDLSSLPQAFSGGNPANVDTTPQHVGITASVIRMGLNMKLLGSFVPVARMALAKHWLFYVGGFAAYYSANFDYGGVYFDSSPGSQIINNNALQKGVAGGGQVGFQYHSQQTPYFVGLSLSGQSNANKGRLTVLVFNDPAGNQNDFNYQFRITTNVDITSVFGADITAITHVYGKVGASYAQFKYNLNGTFFNLPFPIALFSDSQNKNLWGWVVGVGLTQDLFRWLSIFAEYDRYDYGNHDLNSLNRLLAPGSGNDRLTQHVRITSYGVRLGLNVKFAF